MVSVSLLPLSMEASSILLKFDQLILIVSYLLAWLFKEILI